MFQAGPEIHSDGADLHFHPHRLLLTGEEYRNLNDHMIAAVSVGLRIPDIILHPDQRDVILLNQHFRHLIDVIDERTDDPDAGHIVQILFDRSQTDLILLLQQFLIDAHRFLAAGNNG